VRIAGLFHALKGLKDIKTNTFCHKNLEKSNIFITFAVSNNKEY
jgi:hypothetical protein